MRGSTWASASSCWRRAAKRRCMGGSFRGLHSPKELCTKRVSAGQERPSVEIQTSRLCGRRECSRGERHTSPPNFEHPYASRLIQYQSWLFQTLHRGLTSRSDRYASPDAHKYFHSLPATHAESPP